jgi:cell division protein FtsB
MFNFLADQAQAPAATRQIAGTPSPLPFSRRRLATFAAAALALAVGYHVVFGQNGLTVYRQKQHDARALAEQVQQLAAENEALKGHVDRLTSDPDAIERQAREQLHYTRPGEVIVTLPPEPEHP